MAWNWDSPHSWARSLGMISVPMFGDARAADHPGQHVIMLDGEKASFSVSFVNPEEVPDGHLDWAWSSNVLWSVLVNARTKELRYRRWDMPDEEIGSAAKESYVFDLVEQFDASPVSEQETVIDRSLKVFREVRTAVGDVGGSDDQTMLTFLSLLDWHKHAITEKNGHAAVPDTWDGVMAHLPAVSSRIRLATLPSIDYPIQKLGELLTSGQDAFNYQLDTDLLLRHASGALFQEAHRQLASQPLKQKKLFPTGGISPSVTKGALKKDAVYTPPSLARLLIEKAVNALDNHGDSIEILDPACGSGVFLIEAYREAQARNIRHLQLVGVDSSETSCEMARYSVRSTIGVSADNKVSLEILPVNSLSHKSWGNPDIIATNPPFVSWENMDESAQAEVRGILGDLYFGRPDKSAAFVVKSLQSLKLGAVLTTLVPESFLTSRYAHRIREWILKDREFQILFIGQFTGFEYFKSAVVEPAFLVIRRSADRRRHLTQQFTAPDRFADRAIRALRLGGGKSLRSIHQFSYIALQQTKLTEDRWKPEQASITEVRDRLNDLGIPQIEQLFRVSEGIRTGDNNVFIVKKWQLKDWEIPKEWMCLFRPDASNTTIRSGKLIPSRYVFYPYDESGHEIFQSESELRDALGGFFTEKLKPNKEELAKRSEITGNWWSLARHRPTWQPKRTPRIISTVFANCGGFTFDIEGDYAVTQGFAWNWRRGDLDARLSLSYVALMNSSVFFRLCAADSRAMRGGQVDLYANHINRVHIPDLHSTGIPSRVIDEMAELGHMIVSGTFPQLSRLNTLAARTYGVSVDDICESIPIPVADNTEERIHKLSRRWQKETVHLSSSEHILSHPAYQEIAELGEAALPTILSCLHTDDPDLWFGALREIAGEDPVEEEHRGSVYEMAQDWIKWGQQRNLC